MNANSDRSQLKMSCREATTAMIDGLSIESSKKNIFLGITIDYELKSDEHSNYLC